MICKNCGTETLHWKFCPKCGTKILEEAPPPVPTDTLCASCGAALNPGAKFCRVCGVRREQPPPPVIPEESTPAEPENPPDLQFTPEDTEKEQEQEKEQAAPIPVVQPAPAGEPANTPENTFPKQESAAKSSDYSNSGKKTSSGKLAVFIFIAAILLLGGVVGAWFYLYKDPPVPAGLLVKTDPGGAEITLDGESIGRTDDFGDLLYEGIKPGRHEIMARLDNYADAKQDIQFTSGEQQEVEFILNSHAGIVGGGGPVTGTSSEIGAGVGYGAGTNFGSSANAGTSISSGTVANSGTSTSSGANANTGANTNAGIGTSSGTNAGTGTGTGTSSGTSASSGTNASTVTGTSSGTSAAAATDPKQKPKETPQDPSKNLASLLVTTDPGNVYVTLDGRSIGQTDDSGSLLYEGVEPGWHDVSAHFDGYTEAQQRLRFESGERQTAKLELDRLTGWLSINVGTRNADIRIRGVGILETYNDQVNDLEIPAGSYTITVSKTGYRQTTRTINVRANASERISIAMEANYTGPSSGTMVWEGEVRGSTMVTIEDGKASTGRVTGSPLPGVPCSIRLSDYRNVSIAYAPDQESDYKRVVLQVNSKGRIKVTLMWTVLR